MRTARSARAPSGHLLLGVEAVLLQLSPAKLHSYALVVPLEDDASPRLCAPLLGLPDGGAPSLDLDGLIGCGAQEEGVGVLRQALGDGASRGVLDVGCPSRRAARSGAARTRSPLRIGARPLKGQRVIPPQRTPWKLPSSCGPRASSWERVLPRWLREQRSRWELWPRREQRRGAFGWVASSSWQPELGPIQARP